MKALPQGQYIKHYRYGMGVVRESDAKLTSIDFDLHGLKRFVTDLVVVELSDLTPPKRLRAKRGQEVNAKPVSSRIVSRAAASGKPERSAAIGAAGVAESRSRLQILLRRKRT